MGEKPCKSKFWTFNLLKNNWRSKRTTSPAHFFLVSYLFFLIGISFYILKFQFLFLYMLLALATYGLGYLERFPFRSLSNFSGKFGLAFIVTFLFSSLGDFIPLFHPQIYDSILLRADEWIFGVNPVLWIAKNWTHPILTEWLQISYFLYFFFVMGAFLLAYIRYSEKETDFVLFSISFCFLLSYLGYIFLPALGPRDPVEEIDLASRLLVTYPQPLQGLFFTPTLRDILMNLEKIKVNAFPSGHTALTLLALRHYFRLTPRFFYLALPVGLSIIIATVYCRYHYVVDVIAGIGLFALVSLIDHSLFRKIKKILKQNSQESSLS